MLFAGISRLSCARELTAAISLLAASLSVALAADGTRTVAPGERIRFAATDGRHIDVSFVSDEASDRLTVGNAADRPLFLVEDDVNENVLVNLFNWEPHGDSIYRWFRVVDGQSLPYPWIFGEDRTDPGFDRDLFIGRDMMWANFRCKLDGTMWLGRELHGPPDRVHPLVLEPGGGLRLQNAAEEPVFYAGGPTKNVGVGTDRPENILTVARDSETDPIADAWTVYSSRRWKKNVRPIEGALDKVRAMRGVRFEWQTRDGEDIGLIAEEVAEVVPEAVAFEEDGTNARSIDYGRLVPILIEAIKEQQLEIEELRSEIASRR